MDTITCKIVLFQGCHISSLLASLETGAKVQKECARSARPSTQNRQADFTILFDYQLYLCV